MDDNQFTVIEFSKIDRLYQFTLQKVERLCFKVCLNGNNLDLFQFNRNSWDMFVEF